MYKLVLGGAAATLIAAFAPVNAQPVSPPPGVAQGTMPAAPPALPYAQHVRVRVMSNKIMMRAEVDEHVRKLFARFDSNHDGFLTREEIASIGPGMMAMHGVLRERREGQGMMMGDRAALFDRLDTNHDGSISREEFMASGQQQRVIIMRRDGANGGGQPMGAMHGMGGFARRLFEMADANHDGRVSLPEAEAAALAHFDRADLNHDGKLTLEERQLAHELIRQHHPS